MPTHTVTRKGSGRTKGSYSFVTLSVDQITAKFADKTTPIKVSRKWAESCGFVNMTSAPAGELTSKTEGFTPDTQVKVKETVLD